MTGRVSAAETVDFASSYDVVYEVNEKGQTLVSEKITLTNLTPIYYPSNFKLNLAANQVNNLSAIDSAGQKLDVKSQEQDNLVVIDVKLAQQVVGIGKQTSFIVKFTTPDFAQKIGDVWQISIPKFNSKLKLESYKANLIIPLSFGEPNKIFPHPISQQSVNEKMLLDFTTKSLSVSGISATFGAFQNYSFNIKYALKGSNFYPTLSSITLPPDTNYQKILISKIDPQPVNVTIDDDGNYLAWYRIPRAQSINIKVLGEAKLFQQTSQNKVTLTEAERKTYTKSQKFWESDNPIIKEKLNEIIAKTEDDHQKVEAIYRYVVGLLKYDPKRISDNIARLGGVGALQNPTSALCMEFTDLFITLARAAGIPTRELDGFGYSTNTKLRPAKEANLLHSWPEYWDENKGWIMVDPTWENTTQGVDFFNQMDLNHLTLSIKGTSSERPIPGSDIEVNLLPNPTLPESRQEVVFEGSNELVAGFPGSVKISIYNRGNTTLDDAKMTLSAKNLRLKTAEVVDLAKIPPFGFQETEISFTSSSFLDAFKDDLTVTINGSEYKHQISVLPFAVFKNVPIIFAGVVGLMLGIYTFILGYHIYKKKR